MTARAQHDMDTGMGFRVRIYNPEEIYAMPQAALAELFLSMQSSFVEITACVSETSRECEALLGRCKGLESENHKLRIEVRYLRTQCYGGSTSEKLDKLTSGQTENSDDETEENPVSDEKAENVPDNRAILNQ